MIRIGIDLGGTKIEGIAISSDGEVLNRKRVPTDSNNGYRPILNKVQHLVMEMIGDHSDYSLGIGTPGALSPTSGKIINSNTTCLIGKPIQQDLEQLLSHPISFENDANCFALAESLQGAGKNHRSVFGVIMGTGVGGGFVLDKKIELGSGRIAGEWGHHKIDPSGPACYCGQRGCIETFISGPALEHHWTHLTGIDMPLTEIIGQTNHPAYFQWKSDFLNWFGIGLSNIINILDPDVVILGGGVSNISFLYSEGLKAVNTYIFSDHPNTPIVQNHLGDSAGVIGAAYLPSLQKPAY